MPSVVDVMKYHLGQLGNYAINSALPQPRTWFTPVFQANANCPEVQTQLQALMARRHEATPAMTGYMEDGVLKIGPDNKVRNCHIYNEAHLTVGIESVFNEMAYAAWGAFGFSAAKPTPEQWQLLVYGEGGFFVPHYDDSRGETYNGKHYLWRDRPSRSMTLLIYLNDDYEGGHISFPCILDSDNKPLRIKPKAGDVVAFPSHEVYTHHVEPVTSGVRYVVSRWFDDTEWYKSGAVLPEAYRSGAAHLLSSWNVMDSVGIERLLCVPSNDAESSITDSIVSQIWNWLKQDMCFDHALTSAVATMLPIDHNETCTQQFLDRNVYTTTVYCEPTWHPNWGGIQASCPNDAEGTAFIPTAWAVRQCSTRTPSVTTPPLYSGLRRIEFISSRVYEMKPELRPARLL